MEMVTPLMISTNVPSQAITVSTQIVPTLMAVFEHTCLAGYDGAPSCTDINECSDGHTNQCETGEGHVGICSDATHGYICICAPGYITHLDKNEWNVATPGLYDQACTEIDECATNDHDCDINATCSDTDGSYYCTCNSGYTVTASGDALGER